MTTLKTNRLGTGYAWDDTLLARIDAAIGKEPSEEPFAHRLGRALQSLAWPFRHKPILTALIEHLLAEVDLVEAAAWQVRDAKDPALALTDGLLKLGRLIQADTRERFADSTLRAIIDNHARATQEGENWADLQRWLNTFYASAQLIASDSNQICLAVDSPTAAQLDIDAQKLNKLEGWAGGDVPVTVTQAVEDFNTGRLYPNVCFTNEGRSLWVVDQVTSNVDHYELGVAGQPRSAVLRGTLDIAGTALGPTTIFVSENEQHLYVAHSFSDSVHQWDMTDGLGTAAYVGAFDLGPELSGTSYITGIAVSLEGDKLWASGLSGGPSVVYQYTFGTPYDVTTLGYDTISFTGGAGSMGVHVGHERDSHWYLRDNCSVTQYAWGTQDDVSTAVSQGAFTYGSGQPESISFSDTGDVFWVSYRTTQLLSGFAIPEFDTTGGGTPYQQDTISAWGAFSQSTQASRPTRGSDTVQGEYAHANGTAHRMSSTDADLLAAFDESDTTLAFRAALDSDGAACTLLAVGDGTTRVEVGWNASDEFYVTRAGTTFTVSAAGAIDSEVHGYVIIMSGTDCDVYIDGTLYNGTIGATSYAMTGASLMSDGAGEYFRGRLYGWAVLAGAQTEPDAISQLNAWGQGDTWIGAADYFEDNLRAVLTMGADLCLDVASGVGGYYSDATDPPETMAESVYFAVELE